MTEARGQNPTLIAEALAGELGARLHVVNVSFDAGAAFTAEKGRLSRVERWSEGWVSLEVEDEEGRPGFSSATLGGSPFDARALVASALASARVSAPDPARRIWRPEVKGAGGIEGVCDDSPPPGETMGGEMAVRLEEAALAFDSRVKSARKPTFEAESASRLVMVCGVVAAFWRETSFVAHLEVAAESGGQKEAGWASADARFSKALDVEAVGREAARRAVSLLGARRAPTGVFPAVIDGRVAAEILEVLAPSFLADSHRKKTSLFPFEPGRRLFSPLLTIKDAGNMAGGPASQPVDDEGAPTGSTVCVRSGGLEALLYDRGEAARSGAQRTGNGFGGPGGPASPDVSNFFIEAGSSAPGELVGSLAKGVYVTEVMGMHTADPITGDFSVGCSGFLVEGGQVAHPFTQAALSGNLLALFADICGLGNDFGFHGSFGAPSFLVAKVDLTG